MPRAAGPWFRGARSMWFYTDPKTKVQHPLGVTDPADQAGAEAAMRNLIAELSAAVAEKLRHPATPPPPAPGGPAVAEAVRDYLAQCDRKVAAGKMGAKCRYDYARPLAVLSAELGSRPLASLTAEELEAWAARDGWSVSTRNTYLGVVATMLRWCRVTLPEPLQRPHKESRGADVVLTDGQFAEALAAVDSYEGDGSDMAALLRVLRETGARPQEVARLAAADVDWDNACVRRRQHKTKKKTGADRVIHFNAAALAVLAAQRDRHPEGLLFRTNSGTPFTPGKIVRRLQQVTRKVGFRVIAYGLGRHSFATRALAAGVPDAIVAELLGHVGTGMLQFHYSHLGQQAQVLKAAVEKASSRPPDAKPA